MRIAKAHQQPYHGFAWDHPLRVRWREMGKLDPSLSERAGLAILKLGFLRTAVIIVLVASTLLIAVIAPRITTATTIWQHLQRSFPSIAIMGVGACILSLYDLPKNLQEG